jgi:hypothetical protein
VVPIGVVRPFFFPSVHIHRLALSGVTLTKKPILGNLR